MDSMQAQEAFLQAMNRLRKLSFSTMADMSKGEFFLLTLLQKERLARPERKGMYVSELARRMRVTPPAVSRMLRGLEQRALIERVVDREDRRTTYIVLTGAGEELRHTCALHMQEYSDRVVRRMGEEDLETLLRLWNRLLDIMSEELPARDGGR